MTLPPNNRLPICSGHLRYSPLPKAAASWKGAALLLSCLHVFRGFHVFLAVLLVAGLSLGAGEKRPPWQRLLKDEDARKAKDLQAQVDRHWEANRFDEALKAAEALAALRAAVQGADHWEAVDARWQVEAMRRILKHDAQDRKEMAGALALRHQIAALQAAESYREAQPLCEQLLAVFRRVLGEEHPLTGSVYNQRGFNSQFLGQHAAAEKDYRTGLAVHRKLLGEEHPDTATSYNNLAISLSEQGRYAEAEPLCRKALALTVAVLGEEHPTMIYRYLNLAAALKDQGKYAEAEPLLHNALQRCRKHFGEEHLETARSYGGVAMNMLEQGKFVDAEQGLRRALALSRKLQGEEHPQTARYYLALANVLTYQNKFAEAEEATHKALEIYRQRLGDVHPYLAHGYHTLAFILGSQGKYREAEQGHRQALDQQRRTLGEEHPDTASIYLALAHTLSEQGKYAEAEPILQQALKLYRKLLGEDRRRTAVCYHDLASLNYVQGKYAEAEALWSRAVKSYERARPSVAASGLERAAASSYSSTLLWLAVVRARERKPGTWQAYEQSLARGTLDDLFTRRSRTAAEQAQHTELTARLHRLDQLIQRSFSITDSKDRDKERERLLAQHRQALDDLAALVRQLEEKYGAVAGRVLDSRTIQKALPPDTALIGWIDLSGERKGSDASGEHWAVLLRSEGPPVRARLRGSGADGAWTDADDRLPRLFRAALQTPGSNWETLAKRLYRQRLAPLKSLGEVNGLPAVKRLIVLPSSQMLGVPVETFAEGYTVSYSLSGTLYAYLKQQPPVTGQGLLALADPVFDPAQVVNTPAPMPPGGLLLTAVTPGSGADRAGLKPGDVLLRYAGTELKTTTDLAKLVEAQAKTKAVTVTIWRDGLTGTRQVPSGQLGVVLAKEPAPQALAEGRKVDQWLAASRSNNDDKYPQLPGTRVEANAMQRLAAAARMPFRLLADSEASEQMLDELARSGELGKYRYLHLATHGSADFSAPLRSAIILSRDRLPDPVTQLQAGLPVYDGRLTAEEVLRHWHLHADLVTLSACQTALGKPLGGEGFVGFAQAFLLAGARSFCLSQWKVHDTATALLMERFYQNLLGQRPGLKGPLPKAAALVEAKDWLRHLTQEEAVQRTANLTNGVARGKGRPALPLLPAVPAASSGTEPKSTRPYAHPYYWAAFILIGDAD